MDFKPNFVYMPPEMEHLKLKCTAEATRVARAHKSKPAITTCKGAKQVKEEAVASIVRGGGDIECRPLVLSESRLQFGQYRGQTFKWLLSHDVGYGCTVLAAHQKKRDNGDVSQSPTAANKDALASYASFFPEMSAATWHLMMKLGGPLVRELDEQRVGLGEFAEQTYRSLYESADVQCQAFVERMRRKKTSLPGSDLYMLSAYIVGRDNEANYKGSRPSAGTSEQPSGPSEPSDVVMLLEADMEVESQLSQASTSTATSTAATSPAAAGCDAPLVSWPRQVLPAGWLDTLPVTEHEWVAQALFERTAGGKAVLTSQIQLWWKPPNVLEDFTKPRGSYKPFFYTKFCLWAPYMMWGLKMTCPKCCHRLTGDALYRTVRRVLDMDGWYFMGTESLECSGCPRKYPAWDERIIEQLNISKQLLFPAVLTYRLACDKRVIGAMRAHRLGNSASWICQNLMESHTDEWMISCSRYLAVLTELGLPVTGEDILPPMHPVPGPPWFRAAYARHLLPCIEVNKARLTSIFGNILRLDCTKKMTTKLAGEAAGIAAWVTNVGNEYGQVLMSVLTAGEGEGLSAMADGLVRRYRDAGKPPPEVLYVDRDCCAVTGRGKMASTFGEWDQLVVCLDVWNLMRRFASGVNTDAHQLYKPFMSQLTRAILELDAEDVKRLRKAEATGPHVPLKASKLLRHCRLRTRGVEATERLVQEVLDHFWEAKNPMGIPLINQERMQEIWKTQRHHLRCIQDPPGVALYTQTGEVIKGGVALPVFRCARGFSLLSFHLHQRRVIPGTSANALHFQVCLLEGLTGWNEKRAREAAGCDSRDMMHCYHAHAMHAFQQVTRGWQVPSMVRNYTPPTVYTGELIGVEYLRAQTGGAVLKYQLGRHEEDSDDWQDKVGEDDRSAEEEWGDDEEEGGECDSEFHRQMAMSVEVVDTVNGQMWC